jgi:hypothetical protein
VHGWNKLYGSKHRLVPFQDQADRVVQPRFVWYSRQKEQVQWWRSMEELGLIFLQHIDHRNSNCVWRWHGPNRRGFVPSSSNALLKLVSKRDCCFSHIHCVFTRVFGCAVVPSANIFNLRKLERGRHNPRIIPNLNNQVWRFLYIYTTSIFKYLSYLTFISTLTIHLIKKINS